MKSWEWERMIKEEGREEGRKEAQCEVRVSIFKNCLERGMSREEAMSISGATEEMLVRISDEKEKR